VPPQEGEGGDGLKVLATTTPSLSKNMDLYFY